MNTQISDAIDVAEEKVRLDAQIKKILANKKILSWIVKYTMKEFAEMDFNMIESCIEGEPEVSKVPVYPGKTNMESITGLSTEDNETCEEQNKLIQMLTTLFATEMDKDDKKKKLQEQYGIPMDDGFGTEVDDMGNVSEYFISRGLELGMEKGMEKGMELGMEKERTQIIQKALNNGKTTEQVSEFLSIPLDEVRKVELEMELVQRV